MKEAAPGSPPAPVKRLALHPVAYLKHPEAWAESKRQDAAVTVIRAWPWSYSKNLIKIKRYQF